MYSDVLPIETWNLPISTWTLCSNMIKIIKNAKNNLGKYDQTQARLAEKAVLYLCLMRQSDGHG